MLCAGLWFLLNFHRCYPCQSNKVLSPEAHVPTPWYGHYRTHAQDHITLAVAAMDSCFALVGAHQHGIASTVSLADHRPYLCCRGGCKSTPLSASSTVQRTAAHSNPKEEGLCLAGCHLVAQTQGYQLVSTWGSLVKSPGADGVWVVLKIDVFPHWYAVFCAVCRQVRKHCC